MASASLQLEELLTQVLEKNASDLYLTAGKGPILRVRKELLELTNARILTGADIRMVLSSLADENAMQKFDAERELDFSYQYKDIARFRVRAYMQKGQPSIALRNIPKHIPTLEELNLPSTIKSFATVQKGLVLFVSPTGSGKSTTISSLLDFINHTQSKRILTIENPVEYVLQSDRSFCEQQEIGRDTLGYDHALKNVLRAGVDVVMVSRLDTPEVIERTLLVAETGHLVFGTVNTSYAVETINWIVDLFPLARQVEIRTRLANVIAGIVTQQLIPSLTETLVPAVEILMGTTGVKNLLREGKTYQLDDVITTGIADGMLSLDRSLVELVKNGIVAKEEAMIHVKDIPTFESLLQS